MNLQLATKMIASIKTRGATFNRDVQKVLVFGITHAAEHGDHTVLSDLFAVLSYPNQRQVIAWLSMCSPLVAGGKGIVKSRADDAPEYNPDWAALNVWHNKVAKPKELEEFDDAALLKLLEKRAEGKNTVDRTGKRCAAWAHALRAELELAAKNAGKAVEDVAKFVGKKAA